MILVDKDIKAAFDAARLTISPFDPELVQPASYDMRLADEILRIRPTVDVLDPRDTTAYTQGEKVGPSGFLIHPAEFLLAASVEVFMFAADLIGQINGKSSLARLGLQVESAGYFDPGWHGRATLELVNMAQRPIRLYPGMKIAQMVFIAGSGIARRPYGHPALGSKYQGQDGPLACIPDKQRYP